LDQLGAPLRAVDLETLLHGLALANDMRAVTEVMRVLDVYALAQVTINPEGRVSVTRGKAPAELVENGWSVFLIKVRNQGAVTGRITMSSQLSLRVSAPPPNQKITSRGVPPPGPPPPVKNKINQGDGANRCLYLPLYHPPPMTPTLSGLEFEYCIVQV